MWDADAVGDDVRALIDARLGHPDGVLAARARGRLGGRPRALDPCKVQIAQALYHDKTNAIPDICRTLRISRATLYRYLKTETAEPT